MRFLLRGSSSSNTIQIAAEVCLRDLAKSGPKGVICPNVTVPGCAGQEYQVYMTLRIANEKQVILHLDARPPLYRQPRCKTMTFQMFWIDVTLPVGPISDTALALIALVDMDPPSLVYITGTEFPMPMPSRPSFEPWLDPPVLL